MKQLILILFLLSSGFLNAQTTLIPDSLFEQELINQGLDTGSINGMVPTPFIDTVTVLDISWLSIPINNVTGIEDFSALVEFLCSGNNIDTLVLTQNYNLEKLYCHSTQMELLDVTMITTLKELHCNYNLLTSINITQNTQISWATFRNNLLTSIDVSNNGLLVSFDCRENQLTALDVSNNPSLTWLGCADNQISNLEVSQNPMLGFLFCEDNQLTCLNMSGVQLLPTPNFDATNNPLLTCIEVDSVSWAVATYTNIDPASSFNNSCSNPCAVGIDELLSTTVSIYPNPTTRNIIIISDKVLDNPLVTIRNSLGQKVLSNKFATTDTILVELNFPDGLYFITIRSADKVITKKILKK